MSIPRLLALRSAALVVLLTGLCSPQSSFAQQAPLVTGTLNDMSALVNTADNVDLTGYFRAQDATGTVVQFTLTTDGTTPDLSGTQVINLALTDDLTPITVANFLSYVRTGAYDHSFFHRSHNEIGLDIIQGGGFLFSGTGAVVSSSNVSAVPAASMIANEASDSRPNTLGTISMARLGSGPNTATTQWFINTGDNTDSLGTLNGGGYAVFGHVLGNGMNVADAISAQPIFNFSSTIHYAFSELPLSNRTSGDTSSPLAPGQLITVQSARVIPALTFTAVSDDPSIVNATVSDAGVLALNYLASGTTTVTVTATDLDQVSTSQTFTVGVQTQSAALVGFINNAFGTSGTAAFLSVVRTGGTGAFTVEFSTFDGSAIAGSDYVATSGTLNFSPSDTSHVITIPILAGTGSRSFGVQLSNPSNGSFLGLNPASTVLIANPTPNGMLQFSQPFYYVQEGADALFIQVTRNGGSAGAVSAVVSTGFESDTAMTGVDYTGLTQRVSFADGDTTPKTIVVPISNPNTGSVSRHFSISLTALTGGATLGATASASAIIYDQTSPNGVFVFASPEFRCSGTGAVIAVQRLTGSSGTSNVVYSTENGTAVAGANYTATSGTLTFGPGETRKTFVVPVVTDTVDRTVSLHLAASGSETIGGAGYNATLVIAASSQTGVIEFEQSNYSLTDSGALDVTLVRTGDLSQDVTAFVNLIDGSAILGTDYAVTGATGRQAAVEFAAGASSATLSIATRVGTNGNFSLQLLTTTQGGAVGAQDTTTISVPDFFQIIPASYRLSRTNGKAVVTVSRTGTNGAQTVDYSTSDASAVAGTDYAATIGTLTFAPGVARKNVEIPFLAGNGTDPATFTFSISNPTNGGQLGTQSSIPITIVTNPTGGIFSFDAGSYRFYSGYYYPINILRSGTDQAATAYVQLVDGSGQLNVDYLVSGGTNAVGPVFFAAGQESAKLYVGAYDGHGDRTMTVKLFDGSDGSAIGMPNTAPVVFLDRTIPHDFINFSSPGYRVSASNGEAVATVVRSGTEATTVAYSTADGTGVSGSDYVATSGTLTFPAGVASLDIHVPILSGTVPEVNFTVTLSNPTGFASIGDQNSATITIVNSAQAGVFSFGSNAYQVNSISGGVATILRTGATTGTAAVTIQAVDGSAKLAQGGYLVNGTNTALSTVFFADGEASKTIPIQGGASQINKNFTLRLVDASVGCSIGTPGQTTITLLANGMISFGSASYRVPMQSGSAVIRVIRNDGSVGPVSVAYSTQAGTGLPRTDYVAVSGTLNFADGVASQDISVPLIKTTNSGDRTFNVSLSNPTGNALLASPTTATVTIVKSATNGIYSFSQSDYAFQSGYYEQISVLRTGTASASVNVQLIDGTGKFNTDYLVYSSTSDSTISVSGSTVTLSFAANQESKTFLLGAYNNGNRTMTLQLVAPAGAAVSPYGTAPVTFFDYTSQSNPNGLIEFASATYRIDQSVGKAFVTVVRSDTVGDVTIDYATSDGTARAGAAYTGTSGTLHFPTGVDAINIEIPLLNKSATTADQSFNVALTNPTGGADLGYQRQTTVTIVKSVPASVFKFSSNTCNYPATTGSLGRLVPITRTGNLTKPATVYVALVDGTTGRLGSDFSIYDQSGTIVSGRVVPVTFGTNAATQSLLISAPVTTTKDLVLRLVSATPGSGIGSPSQTTVTFFPQGTIQFGSPSFRFCESDSNAIVSVIRSGTAGTVSASYSTNNGTAVSGTDYTATSGTLTFQPGEVSKTITVPLIPRTAATVPDRTLTLNLTNPSDGTGIGALNQASVTIVKKPANGIFSFSQGGYRFDGDGNNHFVTVVRSTPAPAAATAYVELVNDTGVYNLDYFTTGTTTGTGQVIPVKFAAGQTSATFTLGEPTGRGNNVMKVVLVDASAGSAVGTLNAATVSFFDAGYSKTLVEVSPSTYWLSQTATGAIIRVVRTGTNSTGTVAVGYTTADGTGSGAAVSGVDYTLTSGTLTFGPGVVTQDILVPVVSGSSAMDHNFSVKLNGSTVGASDTAAINIIRSVSNGVIMLSSSSYRFDTDNYLYNVVTVTRSASGKPAVAYVELVDGTARLGTDYFTNNTMIGGIASTGTATVGGVVVVNFAATQTSGTFALGAPVGHGDKSMTVRLIGTEAGNAIGTPGSASIQFLDVNRPQGIIEFSPATYRENQSAGQALVTLVRSGTAGTVSVVYNTVDGTAKSGTDYLFTTGTARFAPGQSCQILSVPLLRPAGTTDKTFQVVLNGTSVTGSAIAGAQSQATVTIAKAAPVGLFSFSASNYVFNTDEYNYVTVTRNTTGTAATAYVLLANGTGANPGVLGTDYIGDPLLSGSVVPVTFTANASSAYVTLGGLSGKGDRNMIVKLIGVSGNGGFGSIKTATVTFLDAYRPGGFVSFWPVQYRVSRSAGNDAILTLFCSGTSPSITVHCKTVDGTAKAGVDYTAINQDVTFGPRQSTLSILVPLLKRTTSPVSTHTFQVILTGTATAGSVIDPDRNQADVTIVEDINSKGAFEFESPAYAFDENAGWAELNVLRTSGTSGPADITVYTQDGSGIGRNALYQWPGPNSNTGITVHFIDGQNRQKVLIPVNDGALTSGSSSFWAVLSNPTAGVIGYQDYTLVTVFKSRDLTTPSVEFDTTQYRVNDAAEAGGNGSVILTAKLYGSSTNTVSVPFQIQPGSAILNTDYLPASGTNVVLSASAAADATVSGTFTFQPGVTSVALPFTVYHTAFAVPEKQFSVQIMPPNGGATLLAQTTATVTIVNTGAPKGVFELQDSGDTVKEDNGGVAATIVRTSTSGSAQVIVTTQDGSAEGSQYDSNGKFTGYGNFAANRQTLIFAPGEATKTFDAQVFSGTTGNPLPANFMVRIESVSAGAAIGARDREIVTIEPWDTITQTAIGFPDQKSYDVDESATYCYIPVRRADISTSSSDQLTVNYTVSNGTAITGTDYLCSSGTLTFTPGGGNYSYITAVIIDRPGRQPDRTFSVQLSNPADTTNPANPVALLSNTNVEVTIHDLDAPNGTFEFDRAVYNVFTGNTSVTFMIVRKGDLSRSGTVGLQTADGSAVAGIDYSGTNGTIVFAPGQAYQQITRAITARHTDERFFVARLNPTATSSVGAVGKTTVYLVPTLTMPAVQFSQSSYTIPAGKSAIVAPVQLYFVGDTVKVTVTTVDGDATANVDYQPISGTVTLTGASPVFNLPVNAISSGTRPHRTFFLKLSSPIDQTNANTPVGLLSNIYVPVKL